ALAAERWTDVEKRMFEQPPRQLAWVTRPELYVKAEQSKRSGLPALLARLEAPRLSEQWIASRQPCTPAMVRQAAALMGAYQQAEKALRTWDEAATLLWSDKRD